MSLRRWLWALACIPAVAFAQNAAESILDAGVLRTLAQCTQPRAVCVAEAAQALKNCVAAFCREAERPGVLAAEDAQKSLEEVAAAFGRIGGDTAVLGNEARVLRANALQGVADLRAGKKVEANPWDPATLDNPSGDIGRNALAACKPPADCNREAANLAALRISSLAYRDLVRRMNWQEVERSAACSRLLRQRYESYFDAARFQWPWELYINGLPGFRGETPLMCEGFRDVPRQQWIVLHPSLGVRYSENAAQKTDAAILIELIGFRRWQWAEGKAVNARGASAVLSYSNQSDATRFGWGGLVHVRDDVSVGLVKHQSGTGNRVSLVFGYAFGQLFKKLGTDPN